MGESMTFRRRTGRTIFCTSAAFFTILLSANTQQVKGPDSTVKVAPSGNDTAIRISAQRSSPGRPLAHSWSKVVGAGRANEGLRATWQEELETAHRYGGFQYVRFHGIFHDD